MGATFLNPPVDVSPTGYTTNTWVDLDLSANIPAGNKGAILHYVGRVDATRRASFRPNGSTDTFMEGDLYIDPQMWHTVGVDTDRICEFNFENDDTGTTVYLVGYLDDDYVAVDPGSDYTPGVANVWTDADITSDTTGAAIAAVFHLGQEPSKTQTRDVGARHGDSTDSRTNPVKSYTEALVGLATGEIAQVFSDITTANGIMLIGYFNAGVTMNVNGIDRSLATTGVWTDLPALPTGAIGGIYEIIDVRWQDFSGLRRNGTTENELHSIGFKHGWSLVGCDGSQLVEGQRETTDTDFFEIGSYDPAAAPGGGRIMGSLAGHGGLAGMGGLAGNSGGVAG